MSKLFSRVKLDSLPRPSPRWARRGRIVRVVGVVRGSPHPGGHHRMRGVTLSSNFLSGRLEMDAKLRTTKQRRNKVLPAWLIGSLVVQNTSLLFYF